MLSSIKSKLKFKISRYIKHQYNKKQWLNIASAQCLSLNKDIYLYFGKNITSNTGIIKGGDVKLQWLKKYFKESKELCNIIYLVSSSYPIGSISLVKKAKEQGIKFVWNQNGISYKGSQPYIWQNINNEMKQLLNMADYVIYQSNFCKIGADNFLNKYSGQSQIVYNSVDTSFYKPLKKNNHPLTIILGGNQYSKYRLESALYTLSEVKETMNANLIITGKIAWNNISENKCKEYAINLSKKLNIYDSVVFTGVYSQKDAPVLLNKADILLHTKLMDPCPGIVIEAMSCGLPVAYIDNGGTSELVGNNCGIGVKNESDYSKTIYPDNKKLAEAILTIYKNLNFYSNNARKRAINTFNIDNFIKEHQSVFNKLLNP